jgi:site-specific recombinase XerD
LARQETLTRTPLSLTIADYMDWQALCGSSKRHLTDIKRELLRFEATLESDLPVEQVTREHCTAYFRRFQERECKANILAAYHRIVGAFFRWCVEEELMADTGQRISEALNIHLGDVDTRARAITVVGKGDKPRTVFYGEAVAPHLRNHLRRRERRGSNDSDGIEATLFRGNRGPHSQHLAKRREPWTLHAWSIA